MGVSIHAFEVYTLMHLNKNNRQGLFHYHLIGGCFLHRSKAERLRRRFFCSPNSQKQASLVRKTKNPRKFVGFELIWRRERDCLRFAQTSIEFHQKIKCWATPLSFFLAVALESKLSKLHQ
jgi:hypothetical protein